MQPNLTPVAFSFKSVAQTGGGLASVCATVTSYTSLSFQKLHEVIVPSSLSAQGDPQWSRNTAAKILSTVEEPVPKKPYWSSWAVLRIPQYLFCPLQHRIHYKRFKSFSPSYFKLSFGLSNELMTCLGALRGPVARVSVPFLQKEGSGYSGARSVSLSTGNPAFPDGGRWKRSRTLPSSWTCWSSWEFRSQVPCSVVSLKLVRIPTKQLRHRIRLWTLLCCLEQVRAGYPLLYEWLSACAVVTAGWQSCWEAKELGSEAAFRARRPKWVGEEKWKLCSRNSSATKELKHKEFSKYGCLPCFASSPPSSVSENKDI